jgi:hypothetical protein
MNTSAGTFNTRDVNFACSGSGSTIAVEINIASGTLNLQVGAASGGTADVAQTAGTLTLGATTLVNSNANGLGFTPKSSTSKFFWGTNGAVTAGTRFFYPGTAADTANEPKTRIDRSIVACRLTARSRVAVGGPDVITVRKNGVNTAITVTIPAAGTSVEVDTISASFAAGDDISLQYARGTAGANDVSVTLEFYG